MAGKTEVMLRFFCNIVWYNLVMGRIIMPKKRMGRPELPESQKRTKIMRFVVTATEERKIKHRAKAMNKTVSEFLRHISLSES
jgi:hypothetical protein